MRAPFAVAVLAGSLACGHGEVFACRQDADCSGAAGGRCEPDGWCSFPDDTCDSGRRYGHWVGDELADTCVPSGVADTGGTTAVATTTTDGSSSSIDPGSAATTVALTSTSADSSSSPTDPSSGGAESSSSTGDPDADRVAWYRFEEESFDGVVIDSVNGHDGSCEDTACPSSTPGMIGNAAAFDGIDDIVRVADHVDFATAEGFTLAAWVQLASDQPDFRSLVAKPRADDTDDDVWELGRTQDGRATANMTLADGERTEITADTIIDDVGWVHVATTWDGATHRLFVAGVEVAAQDAASILLTEHDLYFGASWDYGVASNFLLGALDELQIWRRALDADEIAALGAP